MRALSHQFYHTEELHRQVREEIVNQLYTHPELYRLPQSPEDRQIYLENLLIDGTWENGVTLQAAADVYSVRIFVVQSSRVDSFFEIIPNTAYHSLRYDRVIHLSYLENEHYNSLHPEMREKRVKWGNSVNSHIWF